ncbi:MAG: hypothetical protein ACR2J3_09590 [Aridibacter sp.]
MKPKEISKIIEKEINNDSSITNWHNCDLENCLIRPKKRKLWYADELKEFWIVLEENRETLKGFKIFFDEESRKFGLAGWGEPFGYVCNLHDTFLAAFRSM